MSESSESAVPESSSSEISRANPSGESNFLKHLDRISTPDPYGTLGRLPYIIRMIESCSTPEKLSLLSVLEKALSGA